MKKLPAPATGNRHIEITGSKGREIAAYLGTNIVPIRSKDFFENNKRYYVVAFESLDPGRQRAIAQRVAAANDWSIDEAIEISNRNGVLVAANLARIVPPEELAKLQQEGLL